MNQPEKCKYTPLEDHLRLLSTTRKRLSLSFEQIEAVMHSSLPRSAYDRLTWWDNTVHSTLSHKHAWLHAGWLVNQVDLPGKNVIFVRNSDAERTQ